jgi:hypothetical protein
LASWFYTELRKELLEKFSLEHKDDIDYHEKLMTLISTKIASLWVDVFPNAGLGQTMINREYRTMLKIRFGIDEHEAGQCQNCSKMADASGYHAYVCNGKNNSRHTRHQLFGAGLQQILYLAGFKPTKDANVCIGPNNEA